MRSRTSRGVPEWSGGKDLYIGSPVSATEKVLGVTGIVPGPSEGSWGSIGWGHLSRRAPWAEVGRGPAPGGLVRPPLGPPTPRVGNPRWGGAPLALGGTPPPWPPPPWEIASPRASAPPGGLYKGGQGGGQPHPKSWRLPSPATPRPPPAAAWRSPAGVLLHPPPRRRAAGSSSTSPSPCWIKTEETSR